MNYSNIEHSNLFRVMNYLNKVNSDSNLENSIDSKSDSNSNNNSDCDYDIYSDSNSNTKSKKIDDDKKTKDISIILVGPFTPTQKALTMKRVNIWPNYISATLKWL